MNVLCYEKLTKELEKDCRSGEEKGCFTLDEIKAVSNPFQQFIIFSRFVLPFK